MDPAIGFSVFDQFRNRMETSPSFGKLIRASKIRKPLAIEFHDIYIDVSFLLNEIASGARLDAMQELEDAIHEERRLAVELSKMAYEEHLERAYEIKKQEAGLEAARANHLYEEVKAIRKEISHDTRVSSTKREKGKRKRRHSTKRRSTSSGDEEEDRPTKLGGAILWGKTDSEAEDDPEAKDPRYRGTGKGRNGKGGAGKAAAKPSRVKGCIGKAHGKGMPRG